MKSRIYLDNNATTPIDRDFFPLLEESRRTVFGNPSSIHHEGQVAKTALLEARSKIAASLLVRTEELFFTASATEAINLILRGSLWKRACNNPFGSERHGVFGA